MTTIAWDGRTLAADKRATNSGLVRTVTKLFRANGFMVAVCGDLSHGLEMVEWISRGADPATLPAQQRSENWSSIVTIDNSGVVRLYEQGAIPFVVEDQHFACGSGRDYAMAAMHLGCDAARAVGVATVFQCDTGNGVDTMTLGESL